MKTKNNSIGENGAKLLKSLVGKKLMTIKHDKFIRPQPVVFQRVGFVLENGFLTLDNRVDWMDDWFSMADYIPHLTLNEVKSESDLVLPGEPLTECLASPINEKISDVLLIEDDITVLKDGEAFQKLTSSEGIIIETEIRQYAFYKENVLFNEDLLIYRGHNVIEKVPDFKAHWDIFAKPYDGRCSRKIISMKTGETIRAEFVEEVGEIWTGR